ncbi:MAG: alpha/beta hydrolase fold protein [Solirubrobacterales bacterium]|nr:alpha/beta hydrolase fold protein [Solirubrobacterales bacterium]
MPEITIAQGTIEYRETPGTGAPVVFVHGFLVNARLWGGVQDELARRGIRSYAPDLPLASHRRPLAAGADRSPRGIARLIIDWLEAMDLHDVTLVGNDTGGALCQFVLDTDASRIGRLVLTNCDTFDRFPPPPFDLGVKAARIPGVLTAVLQGTRLGLVRDSRLGFGTLVKRRLPRELTADWVRPYLTNRAIRRDTLALLRAVDPAELLDVSTRLQRFGGPVLLCWAPEDRFFRIEDARRLRDIFTDAELVEIPDSRTFVALDQPRLLAGHIVAFAGAQAGSRAGAIAPAGM